MIVICLFIMLTARFIARRRHDRWLKELNRAQVKMLGEEEMYEIKRQKDLNMRMKPLVVSDEVPLIIKMGIPLVIFGNIALFLSGHLVCSVCASLYVFSSCLIF